MTLEHWGTTIQTPTLGRQRDPPLARLPANAARCAIRGPSDQRQLRGVDEQRSVDRRGRGAGSNEHVDRRDTLDRHGSDDRCGPDDQPDGGGVG